MNALERMKREKIGISADDMCGVTAYGKFKKFVVLGIAAGCDPDINIYPFSFSRQGCDEGLDVVFIEVSLQIFSVQYIVKLGEHWIRKKNLSLEKCQIESFARLGIGQEQGADEYVRIENETQLFAL